MMQGGIAQCPMTTGGMWGMLLFGTLVALGFLAAVGVGIYMVARSLRQDDALMVLRRRLALGEIDEAEYELRLGRLKH